MNHAITNNNHNNNDQLHRRIAPDVKLGERVKIFAFTNLYGCEIGDDSKIGAFVEIQKGARIGRRSKVSSHTFICEGVTVEDEVFIGHNVTFINDRFPRATNGDGSLQTEADWACIPTVVKRGASIGSGATILCGVTIGEGATVGAGTTRRTYAERTATGTTRCSGWAGASCASTGTTWA